MALPGLGWFAKIIQYLGAMFGLQVAQSAINKAILIGCFTLILPVVLNNVLYTILEKALNFASSNASVNGGQSFIHQFTGFGGYIADHLMLPTCISILLSAVATRFALRVTRII